MCHTVETTKLAVRDMQTSSVGVQCSKGTHSKLHVSAIPMSLGRFYNIYTVTGTRRNVSSKIIDQH